MNGACAGVRAVARFVAELERAGIPLCHWKGGAALAAGLRGERDLDFLVPPEAFARAETTLAACGFKAARSRFARESPGTAHHFGYEPGLERLLHVHLHDRVLSGEDLITSHAFPFAEAMLESPAFADGVRVPTPALETALLVAKHAVRWGSWPDRLAARLRPKDEGEALERLLTPPNVSAAAAFVARTCSGWDVADFEACARVLRAGGPARDRRRLATRARNALAPFRTPSGERRWRSYAAAIRARVRRLLDGDRRDKALRVDGACIAFVGLEAAARAGETARWLGQAFAVRVVTDAAREPTRAAGEIVLVAGEPRGWHAGQRIALETVPDREALRSRVWEGL